MNHQTSADALILGAFVRYAVWGVVVCHTGSFGNFRRVSVILPQFTRGIAPKRGHSGRIHRSFTLSMHDLRRCGKVGVFHVVGGSEPLEMVTLALREGVLAVCLGTLQTPRIKSNEMR